MAAQRVALERGEAVGETVGYQFRFENVSSPRTRLRFLTEGMLMRRLLDQPELSGVSAVVLDEFHERHIHGDLALAVLRRLQLTSRPELRILVMSATLQAETVAQFLGNCPIRKVEGRMFEVGIEYLPVGGVSQDSRLEGRVREAVTKARATRGDILVFLPGMAEIRRAHEAIEAHPSTRDLLCLPLHGELSKEEQDRAIQPGDSQKVILSTNVAETSLTIDGITSVVDSGLHRSSSYSSWSGLPALVTKPISRASAIQRAGRAGRTAPGRCYRLYAKGEFDARAPYETPEIQRADLSQTLLELASLGVRDFGGFGWFEKPSDTSLENARSLLYRLGALDLEGGLTALGSEMVTLPVHPRLARLCLEARHRGVTREGVTLAAWISEGRMEPGDLLSVLKLGRGDFATERMRERLERTLASSRKVAVVAPRTTPAADLHAALRFSVLCGFPDRVARKRVTSKSPGHEMVFSTGGSSPWQEQGWTAGDEYFVAVDVEERRSLRDTRSTIQVRSLCPISEDWLLDLEPEQVREESECILEGDKGRVEEVSRLMYDQLVLSESRTRPHDPEKLGKLLAQALIRQGTYLPKQEKFLALMERFRFIEKNAPDLGFCELSPVEILDQLGVACWGKTNLAEAAETDLASQVLSTMEPGRSSRMESAAPEFVQLARGRRIRVHYESAKPPWIECRLQDFFGMRKGPCVLGGRVPLTLHLLAPNQRSVQVTADLEGFWSRVYPELRRELGRRYPRHSWPENPIEA